MYCLWLRKNQYLCGFVLDYNNATPTKYPNSTLSGLDFLFTSKRADKLAHLYMINPDESISSGLICLFTVFFYCF